MTLWHKGEPIVFDKKIDWYFITEWIRPKGNYFLCVFLSEGQFYYTIRYWKNLTETPWTTPRLIDNGQFLAQVQSLISQRDKFPSAFVKETDFKIQPFFIDPEDLEEIQQIENNNPPKEKVLIGNSLREILHAEKDLFPRKLMTLAEHEQAVIDNKTNFERIDAIYLLDFLRAHCIRMNQHGVTVMLTLGDRDRPNIGDYREIIAATCDLPNIIYDTENELGDETKWVDIAGERAKYITDLGLPAAGGGFGNSTFGEANDRLFEQKYPMCQYKKIHRPYPPLKLLLDFVEKQKELGKKIICDELLWDHSVPCMEDPERYIRTLKDTGVYGMNIYNSQFKLAGRLCQEFNS